VKVVHLDTVLKFKEI